MSTTLRPNWAAAAATVRPPEPAPITQMSKCAMVSGLPRLPASEQGRYQGQHAQRREADEELRSDQRLGLEAACATLPESGGEAVAHRPLLRRDDAVQSGPEIAEHE